MLRHEQPDAAMASSSQLGARGLHGMAVVIHDAVEGRLTRVVAQLHDRESLPVELDLISGSEVW